MDSCNSLNTQAKKSEAEERAYRRQSRLRIAIILISFFLLLVIVASVAILIIGPDNLGGKSTSSTVSNVKSGSSIKAVCAATLYPDSCYSSIFSASDPNKNVENPEEIFKLSVQVALSAVSSASYFTDYLSARAGNSASKTVLQDCKALMDSAVRQLNETLSIAQAAIPPQIGDIRTLLSAAVADQATCGDGLAETLVQAEMEAATVNATEYTSNSLAIAAKFGDYINLMQIPSMNRKLLAEQDHPPRWASASIHRGLRLLSEGNFPANLTVAKDGTGDFDTISSAIEKVPEKSLNPFVIHVKDGIYEEYVEVGSSKWNVVMVGEGMNRTIVSGSRNRVDGSTAYKSATFTVMGKGFIAMDMTFINTAGPEKHEATAVFTKADRSIFLRCSFLAFHITLYTHSLRQLYRDCHIVGATDIIFGDAAVVFQNCSIQPRKPLSGQKNTITAQTRSDPNEVTGISLQNCNISPFDDVAATPTFLGRPGNKFSRTVVMETEIGSVVAPQGWLEQISGTVPPDTLYFGEYQNSGPGSNLAGRVRWPGYKPIMSDSEAQQYSLESFLQGSKWINI